jgi:hypothetical protein
MANSWYKITDLEIGETNAVIFILTPWMIALFVKIKLPLQNINNISQWIFAFAMTCKNNFGVNNSATFVTKKKINVIETQFLLIYNFVCVQDILTLLYIITKMN